MSSVGRVNTPTARLELNEEQQTSAVQQAFDIWINPEIERRRALGAWPEGTVLSAAQIFLPSPLDSDSPTIRLNSEVRVVAKVEFKAPIFVKRGDPVYARDVNEIQEVRRLPEDDPNAAMITVLTWNGRYHMIFDFRRDVQRAAALIQRAVEFGLSAWDSYRCRRSGPAYDNLYSCAELAAKAYLLLSVFFPYNNPKDHSALFGRFRTWTTAIRLPSAYLQAFERLRRARPSARYLEGNNLAGEFPELFWTVGDLISRIRTELPNITFELEEATNA